MSTVEPHEADGWQTIRKVAPYLWPAGHPWIKWRVVAAMLALVTAKIVAVGTPILYKGAVDALAQDGVPPLALGAVGMTVAYGMARLLSSGFQQLRDALFARVGQRALRSVALETFVHLHRLPLRFHLMRRTGALSRVLERGVKSVEFLLRFLLFSIVPLLLELLLVAAVLTVLFDAWYLAIVAVTIILYIWFTFRVTEWRVKLRREMNRQDTDANQKAIDSLLNFETVKYFAAAGREAERYDRSMAGYERAALKTAWSLALLNFGQAALISIGLVAVMVLAAIGVQRGELTVGDFVMVNAYMIQITMPLGFLGTVYREIRQSLVDMGEMFALLGQEPEIRDRPGAHPLEIRSGTLKFENLSFGYDHKRLVLDQINLEVPGGTRLALVGASGSGKSTIGRLLLRLYEVGGGRILIDGQDIREVELESLHRCIGVVPQDTVLFNDTIRYNIAYGNPDADEQEMQRAVDDAQLRDLIAELPFGFETRVGERGLKLSGGEKQRIGIARTLLKDPPILLLDEATSALDSDTEHSIEAALTRAGTGRTVVAIAHRLSTIADYDQIAVLDHGRVAELGTHHELLARGGRYAHLWRRQEEAAA